MLETIRSRTGHPLAAPARLLVAVLTLATLVTPLPAEPDVAAPEVIREGSYTLRYFGKHLGREEFTISRTEGGYEIRAEIRSKLKEQVASAATYVLDENRRFVSASYRRLDGVPCEAEYRVEGRTLVAEAWEDGERKVQRVPIGPGTIITGPHYVTDFFVLEPLSLAVRAEDERTAYSFGFEGWRLTRSQLVSRREKDRRESSPEGKVETTVYRCAIETPDKTWKTRSWLDDDGVSVRITVDAPIGWLDVRLGE